MTISGISLAVVVALVIYLLKVVHDVKENVEATREFYMNVYLVVRSETDPENTKKQWLLEKFCSFRIVPRVGDTLHLANGQYPLVTEVQLRTDGTCTV